MKKAIENYFKIDQRGSNIKTEIIAGFTTFLSMSYVLFVIPATLSETGMDLGALFTATALSAIISTLIMALYANYPIALAPGMGMQAFFTYTVVLTLGYSWQEALFAIFLSGVLFIILSVSGLRKKIINTIPNAVKHSVTIGIGLFIAFIGMQNVGIIVPNEGTIVGIGNFASPIVILTLIGVVITLILIVRNNNAAIFIGMAVTAILGIFVQLIGIDVGMQMPTSLLSMPPSIEPSFGKLFDNVDIIGLLTNFNFWVLTISILFVDFFDTAGTVIAVGQEAGTINEKGEIQDNDKILLADSVATTIGAVLGVSSVTSYVESMTGIKVGGRTGFTALTVAVLFFLSLFLSPLLVLVTPFVTAPALIGVGALMAMNNAKVNYEDFADSATAFMTIMFMLLTYSISNGLAMGFLTYTILKVGEGKAKEVHPIVYILSGIFFIYFFTL